MSKARLFVSTQETEAHADARMAALGHYNLDQITFGLKVIGQQETPAVMADGKIFTGKSTKGELWRGKQVSSMEYEHMLDLAGDVVENTVEEEPIVFGQPFGQQWLVKTEPDSQVNDEDAAMDAEIVEIEHQAEVVNDAVAANIPVEDVVAPEVSLFAELTALTADIKAERNARAARHYAEMEQKHAELTVATEDLGLALREITAELVDAEQVYAGDFYGATAFAWKKYYQDSMNMLADEHLLPEQRKALEGAMARVAAPLAAMKAADALVRSLRAEQATAKAAAEKAANALKLWVVSPAGREYLDAARAGGAASLFLK